MTQDRPPSPPFGRLVKLKQGYEMHYLEHGSGPAVVFVHGSGPGVNAYSNFFPNYRAIAAAGYRCVLVGNSLGGAISMKLAIDHPARVEKLIVMGPGGIEARETYFKMPGIQKMVSQFVGSGFDRPGLRRLLELLAYDPNTITDELLEQRFNILQTQPKAVLARMSITDLTPELGKLRGPLLGFWGVEDQFCPASGYEKILRAVPDSRFIMYSRCGHWAMIERAEDFNRHAIEFLKS